MVHVLEQVILSVGDFCKNQRFVATQTFFQNFVATQYIRTQRKKTLKTLFHTQIYTQKINQEKHISSTFECLIDS